jgi:hypothetical protein
VLAHTSLRSGFFDRRHDMAERMVTDSRGQRWDVREEDRLLIFRHQSGRELSAAAVTPLDDLSTDELLAVLDDARRQEGLPPVGRGGLDVAFDDEGYETGR